MIWIRRLHGVLGWGVVPRRYCESLENIVDEVLVLEKQQVRR